MAIDWINVDWRKTNTRIAKELDCRVEQVYLARKKYYPDDPYTHDKERYWDYVDWSKSNKQLAEEAGVILSVVRVNRRRYDPNEDGYRSQKQRSERIYKAYRAQYYQHTVHKVTRAKHHQHSVPKISWLYR